MDNRKKCYCGSLSICNLGMAIGVVWGLSMFLVTILTMAYGIGSPFVDIFSSIYWGLDASLLGSVFGLFWGFVDGFIGGALIAIVYNFCAARCPCSSCKTNRECCR